jgi:opacity protein-like surface antigen
MKKFLIACLLVTILSTSVNADVWRWVDAEGRTHFVDTDTAIYTWTDEFGKHHYSDTPDHEDAVSVVLFWHAPGSVEDLGKDSETEDGYAYPGETNEDRAKREAAEAYYCKRATEIYESYINAPQLYRTSEDGEREYLSKKDAAKAIAETRARKDELCG